MRDLPTGVDTLIAAPSARLALMAEFDFPSGWLRLWTGRSNITWSGREWLAIGSLGSISPVKESGLSAEKVSYRLARSSSAIASVLLGEKFRGRECSHWLAFPDAAFAALDADPVWLFTGYMDIARLVDGPGGSIELTAEGEVAAMGRAQIIRYTHEQQVGRFPDDNGCAYVAAMPEKQFAFGFDTPSVAIVNKPGPPRLGRANSRSR